MKLGFVSLTCVLIAASSLFAQGWQWQNPHVCGNDLTSISTFGNTILATSSYGDVLWSSDAGQTWALRNDGGGPCSKTIFLDAEHGWGLDGPCSYGDSTHERILATTDGGITWAVQYELIGGGQLYDICFPDGQNGWVTGDRAEGSTYWSYLLHTTNGGQTWTEQLSDTVSFYWHTCFLNVNEGWIASYRHLLHTTDGGISWVEVAGTIPVSWFCFSDSTHGWGVGDLSDHHDLFRTTDGGCTWNSIGLNPGAYHYIEDVRGVGSNTVCTVTNYGQVYLTHDAGAHWTMWQTPNSVGLSAVSFEDEQHGWIAGPGGLVLRTSDGGARWDAQHSSYASAGAWLYNMAFADSRNGWASGSDVILHTTNSGQEWVAQDSGRAAGSMAVLDSLTVWSTADYGLIKTTDGGVHWQGATIFGVGYPTGVTGYGRNHVWLLGIGGEGDSCLCRSTDAGASWTCFPITQEVSSEAWSRLYFADEHNGWRFGGSSEDLYGFILHTTDGGETWVQQLDLTESAITHMSFVDSLHGWACGTYGVLLKTTDGGEHWDRLDCPQWGLSGVQFFDTLHGWMCSTYGNSLRTTDGGNTWEQIQTDVWNETHGIYFFDFEHGWLYGTRGMILHYDGTVSAPKPGEASIPWKLFLSAYPNPFNPMTILSFDIPRSGQVTLAVYDLTGRLVKTLTDQVYAVGTHRIEFDGSALPSGIYFAQIRGQGFSKTQKLVLLK